MKYYFYCDNCKNKGLIITNKEYYRCLNCFKIYEVKNFIKMDVIQDEKE